MFILIQTIQNQRLPRETEAATEDCVGNWKNSPLRLKQDNNDEAAYDDDDGGVDDDGGDADDNDGDAAADGAEVACCCWRRERS